MAGASQKELDHSYRMRKAQVVQQALKYFFVCLGIFFCGLFFYLSVKELAGRATTAEIVYKVSLLIRAPKALAILLSWTLTIGTTGWAVAERKRSERTIAKFHPTRRLEQLAVDPQKPSSGITLRGKTGPTDI